MAFLDFLVMLSEFKFTAWGSVAYFMLGSSLYVLYKIINYIGKALMAEWQGEKAAK